MTDETKPTKPAKPLSRAAKMRLKAQKDAHLREAGYQADIIADFWSHGTFPPEHNVNLYRAAKAEAARLHQLITEEG